MSGRGRKWRRSSVFTSLVELVVKSCVELPRSCGINILVVFSDIPAFCLDNKSPTTKNIWTRNRLLPGYPPAPLRHPPPWGDCPYCQRGKHRVHREALSDYHLGHYPTVLSKGPGFLVWNIFTVEHSPEGLYEGGQSSRFYLAAPNYYPPTPEDTPTTEYSLSRH